MATEITIPTGNRALTFTHDQLDKIISALYMASGEYNREFKELCARFPDEDKKAKMYWFDKSNMFYDLANDIKNGNFDI